MTLLLSNRVLLFAFTLLGLTTSTLLNEEETSYTFKDRKRAYEEKLQNKPQKTYVKGYVPEYLRASDWGNWSFEMSAEEISCQVCQTGLFGAKTLLENQFVTDIIKQFFGDSLCPLVAKNTSVCHGGANIIGGPLLDSLAKGLLDPVYFCQNIIPICHIGDYEFHHAEEFVNKVIATKPDYLRANNYLNNLYESVRGKNRKMLRAVHVADPHIDFMYTPGSDQNCGNYLCCRPDSGFPTETERQAKEWGSYLCDLPPKTLHHMFEFVRDQIKPDMLLWTGDNSPHTVWDNTPEEVIDSTKNITNMMKEVFGKTTVTVIPIQGNHDVWPANNQDFSKPYGSSYILEFGKMWQEAGWLDENDLKVFDQYGYYSKTLKLKDGREYRNTKIIALNTNTCYYYNFQLLQTRFDPGDQLAWLEAELKQLEEQNGIAILIGHIPPVYYECIHGWSARFKALADRYQHIIRFGVYGHEHDEWMQIYTSSQNPNQRIGISFMSGSSTTFTKKNPSFTVIDIDEELMLPMNFKTYFFNVSQVEQTNQPKWELLHDYLDYYKMTDLSPDNIYKELALKVRDNEEFAMKYLWNKVKQSAVKVPRSCNEMCRRHLFCEITQSEQFDHNKCLGYSTYDFINEPMQAIWNLLTAEWVKRVTPEMN